MITPKDRDMNRSRDVKGPELKRPFDQETTMKDKSMGGGLFHDDAPTGTLSKHPLSELHHGDHETPLTATGEQLLVDPSPMGSDHPDHVPTLAKGSIKDEQHHGAGKTPYKETGQSVGKGSRMPKGAGRSIAKEMEYKAKKKM
jgi:hypothetical protein